VLRRFAEPQADYRKDPFPVENQEKNIAVAPVVDGDDRRTWLIASPPSLATFGGWGPRMESSIRDVLRGLN
jgi:hypothetical protein